MVSIQTRTHTMHSTSSSFGHPPPIYLEKSLLDLPVEILFTIFEDIGNCIHDIHALRHTSSFLLSVGLEQLCQKSSRDQALLYSACFDDTTLFERLMTQPVPRPNGRKLDELLAIAIDRGHESMVKWLLNTGRNANLRAIYYGRALARATGRGVISLVRLVLNSIPNPYRWNNAVHDYFTRALEISSKSGREDLVQLLLDHGASINNSCAGRAGALQLAAGEGHEDVVRLLLGFGANVIFHWHGCRTALQLASKNGHDKVVKLLLGYGARINARERYDFGLLQLAAERGHERVVGVLLEAGASVNTHARVGGTALQRASQSGHDKVVQLLLKAGAFVDARGGLELTPLQLAAGKGFKKVVEILLEAGASVDTHSRLGETALHRASQSGHDKVVKLLLKAAWEI